MTSTPPDPSSFSPSGKAPGDEGATDGFRNLADAAARMLDGYARVMAQLAGGGRSANAGPGGSVHGLPPALAEAWVIASGSATRYGQGLTDVFARHQGVLMQAASAHLSPDGVTPEQRLAEAEEVVQFLQAVREVALHEARRLDKELLALGEAVAAGASEPWPEDADHRRWRVKR